MLTYASLLAKYHLGQGVEHINDIIIWGILVFVILLEMVFFYINKKKTPSSIENIEERKRAYETYYNKYIGKWLGAGRKIFNIDTLINKLRKIEPIPSKIFILDDLGISWIIQMVMIYLCVLILIFGCKFPLIILSHRIFTTVLLTLFVYYKYNTYVKYILSLFQDKNQELLLNIFGASIYKNIQFALPQTFFKDSYGTHIQFTLKDYYINSASTPYLVGDDQSHVTTKPLTYIINAGARYLTFDIYEDLITSNNDSLYVPIVRTAHTYSETYNKGIPFIDMIKALANTNPFSQNSEYPLILHLNFYNQDLDTNIIKRGFLNKKSYDSVYLSINKYFKDKLGLLGNNIHGYGGLVTNNSSFCDIPFSLAKGRLLLVSNINPQNNNLSKNLSQYLHGTIFIPVPITKQKNKTTTLKDGLNPDSKLQHFIYTKDLYNANSGMSLKISTYEQDIINYNKTGITIVIPEECLDSNKYNPIHRQYTYNPNILDCMNYGCQVVLMKYQYIGEELENNLQIFNKGSFILKPKNLRELPEKKCSKTLQSHKVSFESKSHHLTGVTEKENEYIF